MFLSRCNSLISRRILTAVLITVVIVMRISNNLYFSETSQSNAIALRYRKRAISDAFAISIEISIFYIRVDSRVSSKNTRIYTNLKIMFGVCPLLLIQLSLDPTKISTYQFSFNPNNIIDVLREWIYKKTVRTILAKER